MRNSFKYRPFFCIAISLLSISIAAQNIAGKVVYRIVDSGTHPTMSSIMNQKVGTGELPAFAGEFFTGMERIEPSLRFELVFSKEGATFKENEQLNLDEGDRMLIRTLQGAIGLEGCYYYRNEQVVQQKEKDGSILNLIYDDLIQWTIVSDTMLTILDRTCLLAIGHFDSIDKDGNRMARSVSVWFTPQIPVPYGPMRYSELPGLILSVSLNKRKQLVATEIDLHSKSKPSFEPLGRGKSISYMDYLRTVAESSGR